MKIVNTDNYGSDYPDEKFLCWVDSNGTVSPVHFFTRESADLVSRQLQDIYGPNSARYYKPVADDYVLQPGFEP